jgi:pimeloyl-ACP methyl ester carboxylesterase
MFRPAALALAVLWMACPAHALDVEAMVPPGDYVSVDTHRLHYHCTGSGSPAVIIDGGIGGASVEWRGIQAEVSRKTQVCSYDRAGYGWSDPGPSPRTTSRTVNELRRLLKRAGIPPPYLLVGHSFGGFTARYFAASYPQEVAGVVLVESSHPAAGLPKTAQRGQAAHPFAQIPRPEAQAINEDFALGNYLNSRRKAVFAQMDEMTHFARSAREVETAGPLPDVPLRVIARDPALGFPDAREEARWQSRQRSLSRLAPHGHFRIAEGSGHEVHGMRPDVVIAEISAALASVEAQARPQTQR